MGLKQPTPMPPISNNGLREGVLAALNLAMIGAPVAFPQTLAGVAGKVLFWGGLLWLFVMLYQHRKRIGTALRQTPVWLRRTFAFVLVFVAGAATALLAGPLAFAPSPITNTVNKQVSVEDPAQTQRIAELTDAFSRAITEQAFVVPKGLPMGGSFIKLTKGSVATLVLDANRRLGPCLDSNGSSVRVRGKFDCEDHETGLKLRNKSKVDADTLDIK